MTHYYRDIRLQKCRDLENQVKGQWRSLKMSQFDREPMTSYWCSIVTTNYGSISCCFWEIQCWKISRPWNLGQGSIKVIESDIIRYSGYGFLLAFYSNFVPKVFEIFDFKSAMTLKTRLGVCQGHSKCHHSIECICQQHLAYLVPFPRDGDFSHPLVFCAPAEGVPLGIG